MAPNIKDIVTELLGAPEPALAEHQHADEKSGEEGADRRPTQDSEDDDGRPPARPEPAPLDESHEDSTWGLPSEKLEKLRRRAYVSLDLRGVVTEADAAEWPHARCVPTLLQVASAIGDHDSVDRLLRRAGETGIPYRPLTLELALSFALVGVNTSSDGAARQRFAGCLEDLATAAG